MNKTNRRIHRTWSRVVQALGNHGQLSINDGLQKAVVKGLKDYHLKPAIIIKILELAAERYSAHRSTLHPMIYYAKLHLAEEAYSQGLSG